MVRTLILFGNAANAWGLFAVLACAFAFQLAAGEPPCPLCVMQRIAMMMAAAGPVSVLWTATATGLTPSAVARGAGLLILASLLGAAISTRQILLHILPGDPGFGMRVLGYHLYTWSLIVFAANIGAGGLQLVMLEWLDASSPRPVRLAKPTMLALVLMLGANIVSVVAEAGLAWQLPEKPVSYLLFGHGRASD